MFKSLILNYFLQWGGFCKPPLMDCVTKPVSLLHEYINCDDNTLKNPEAGSSKVVR